MNSLELILDFAEEILIPICTCVILPIIIVWLNMRRKTNETNKRTEVLLAAIGKNPELDMEEFIKKMSPKAKTKTTKERLLNRLLWGFVLTAIGIAVLGCTVWIDYKGGVLNGWLMTGYGLGSGLLLVGTSCIAVFFISKKMLAKEIEAEEEKALEK